MYSSGITFTGVTAVSPAPPAPTVTGANNGVSLSGTDVVLGQDLGDPGLPAQLVSFREIPMNQNGIFLTDDATSPGIFVLLSGFEIDLKGDAATGNAAAIRMLDLSGLVSLDLILNTGGLTASIFGAPTLALAGSAGVFVGLSSATATAVLHLFASPAGGVGSASLKFQTGVLLLIPEDGAVEFDGTNYFVTAGPVRYTLAKTLTATAALNFPNTLTLTSSDLTIALTGAADGDVVSLGVPIAAQNANSCYTAFVSAANTVTVRFNNYSALAIDPASGTFRVSITKY